MSDQRDGWVLPPEPTARPRDGIGAVRWLTAAGIGVVATFLASAFFVRYDLSAGLAVFVGILVTGLVAGARGWRQWVVAVLLLVAGLGVALLALMVVFFIWYARVAFPGP